MKQIVLILLFIPQFVFAFPEDPRKRNEARYPALKTLKKVTYFTMPKDNGKLDTCIVEYEHYNEDGLMTQHLFSMIMQKNPRYDYHADYAYSAEDAWTKQVYKRGIKTDSVVVNGSFAKLYSFRDGKPYAVHVYDVDSLQEKVINGGDTIFRQKRMVQYPESDRIIDDPRLNSYNIKSYSRSVNGPDTAQLLNEAGMCMIMRVTKYSGSGQTTEEEFYNFDKSGLIFKRLTYNETLDMSFFLGKSRKGKPSYRIYYSYSEKGELLEEKWVDPKPKRNQVVIRYEYEYYH